MMIFRLPTVFNNIIPVIFLAGSFLINNCLAESPAAGVLLSVQDLEAIGVDQTLARGLSDILRSELAQSARLRVVEETGRLYRMQRESSRLRDLFRDSSLRDLGELLESRYVLTGSVSRLDTLIVITARIVDAESGVILASETVQKSGGFGRLEEKVSELASKIIAHFPLGSKIVQILGDTVVADLGFDDGLRPGQELTVVEVGADQGKSGAWTFNSWRCRVVGGDERTSRLLPLAKNPGWPPAAGSLVVGIGETGGLARGMEKTPESVSSPLDRSSGNFGDVLVESTPSGALAVLSGLDVGRTPVKVAHLATGKHPLYLSLPGYCEVFDSVTVIPGRLEKYSYELKLQTGRLTIFISQPDVSVRIDTLEFPVPGTGVITLEDFPAGSHRIEARKDGFETFSKNVTIDFRQDSTLVINLTPHPGSILVTSQPTGANIFIDGIFTGKLTPWRLSNLPAGFHVLCLTLRDYGMAADTVEVKPGVDLSLELNPVHGRFEDNALGMTLIPAGRLVLSESDTVQVDSFYIDTYEVTNLAYAYYVASTGAKAPSHWKEGVLTQGEEYHPVVNVSWEDAARFAAWCGKRLPREEEWERTAFGESARKYPWGDSYRPGAANIWSEGLNRTARVGSYPDDKSPFGVFDLVGNVSEWVDSWLDSDKTYRVYRGGSYYVNETDPSLFSRDGLYSISKNKYIGFRCTMDFKPSR